MCDNCVELAGRIEHYRWLKSMITDHLTIDRINALIARLEPPKAARIMHKSKQFQFASLKLFIFGEDDFLRVPLISQIRKI